MSVPSIVFAGIQSKSDMLQIFRGKNHNELTKEERKSSSFPVPGFSSIRFSKSANGFEEHPSHFGGELTVVLAAKKKGYFFITSSGGFICR
jgi:hypothetical protein